MSQLLGLIQEEIKKLPSYKDENYTEFMKKYKQIVPKILNEIFYENENGLKFHNKEGSLQEEIEQNGILFSFWAQDIGKREFVFYKGKIWEDIDKKERFYSIFNACKNYFGTTIVDFLLYEENVLIPSKLTVVSEQANSYSGEMSKFRTLFLPIFDLTAVDQAQQVLYSSLEEAGKWEFWDWGDFIHNHDGFRAKVREKKGDDGVKVLQGVVSAWETMKESLLALKEDVEEKKEQIIQNFKQAGVDIGSCNANSVINAVVMHNLSIYARNIMIFSSGTFNNVSGLIFSANPSEKDESNWKKVQKFSNELLYLDGALRQITTYEIIHQEDILRNRFIEDYKERVKNYKVLAKMAKAIFASIENLENDKIYSIKSRIKDIDSLYKKVNNKYKKFFREQKYDELYWEVDKTETLDINKIKTSQEKILSFPEQNIITDLCGIRIIFYYKHESEEFIKKLSSFFNVYEFDNKLESKNENSNEYIFGYSSIHLVLSLNNKSVDFFLDNNRKGANDDNWGEKLKKMVFELQIRTILEHGWADASHDLHYKGKFSKETQEAIREKINREMTLSIANIVEADRQISKCKKTVEKIVNESDNS